ncbi:MAG: terminase family protein, partial [Chthonomonadales bacterium]
MWKRGKRLDPVSEFERRLQTLNEEHGLEDRRRQFQKRPFLFARDMLGSTWWPAQTEIANALTTCRRVAVKSANGVGKTFLAADLTLWFLLSFPGSIVLTTAPTSRQVRGLLWEEIGRRVRRAKVTLPGTLTLMRYEVEPGWFAMGLTADSPDSFQGYHAQNLLIVFDEASGIEDEIWDAAEGIAVGVNNRILAIGNPLRASGRLYEIFRDTNSWKRFTISAMDHPNVVQGREVIPGAVTRVTVDERVKEWCTEADADVDDPQKFEWNGKWYLPNREFSSRILGQFPKSDEDALIPLPWIEAAQSRVLAPEGPRVAAVDVARFGSDNTVIGVRQGMRLIHLESIHGDDVMEVAGKVVRMAFEFHPERISIDAIGVGSGVVDRLNESGIAGL